MDSTSIPVEIKDNLGLRTSKTMLVCFDKAERHLPDRCLRQFGMPQHIPKDVQRWERKIRAVDQGLDLSKDNQSELKGKVQSELKEWLERELLLVEGDDGVEESKYMEWYDKITRKFVGRPESLESEFQRTVSLCLFLISYLCLHSQCYKYIWVIYCCFFIIL